MLSQKNQQIKLIYKVVGVLEELLVRLVLGLQTFQVKSFLPRMLGDLFLLVMVKLYQSQPPLMVFITRTII